MTSENALISRWKQGDQLAAENLYERYRLRLFRLAYGLLGNHADAEEVMQDSLLYALQKIHNFDPVKASFKTWLHTICVSRCRNKRRRKQFTLTGLGDWMRGGNDVPDVAAGVAGSAEIATRNTSLLEAVQTLPPKQREAILLRYWAGHSFPEIAAILGCAESTAKSRVQLAYGKLRLALTDLTDTENSAFIQEALR